jgi:hypothetical protein
MPPFQEPVAQLFPTHSAGWIRSVVIKAMAKEIEQTWVFILLKHDLIEEFLGKNLLFVGR